MKSSIVFAAFAAATAIPVAAAAESPPYKAESPVVVERAANGRATAVRADGKIYPVCTTERQDSCIQPRAAKLGWGDRPLKYWPGEKDFAARRGT
ncbi:hypothetical protein ABVV53_10775 [Novosphingobium sp. RD2P27]|uniref:Uncharacterized protein n=1 Tax=Novosphingobium kalidii TaxID=3230299 RepID=A0ABV2D255_9SPHN